VHTRTTACHGDPTYKRPTTNTTDSGGIRPPPPRGRTVRTDRPRTTHAYEQGAGEGRPWRTSGAGRVRRGRAGAVEGEGAHATLTWTPGPSLRGWVLGDADTVLRSAPMPAPAAHAVLAQARVEPMGLATRHRVTATREWFEGHRQRGVQRCWRVLEMDLEQRLRQTGPGSDEGARDEPPLGPPMTTTVRLRDLAAAERCAAS